MNNKSHILSEAAAQNMELSLQKHEVEPNVSLDEYVRNCTIELGKSLEEKIPIYLDQRYWIIVRNVALERDNSSDSKELFKSFVPGKSIF